MSRQERRRFDPRTMKDEERLLAEAEAEQEERAVRDTRLRLEDHWTRLYVAAGGGAVSAALHHFGCERRHWVGDHTGLLPFSLPALAPLGLGFALGALIFGAIWILETGRFASVALAFIALLLATIGLNTANWLHFSITDIFYLWLPLLFLALLVGLYNESAR